MLEIAFEKKPLVLKSDVNDRYIFLASNSFENFNFNHLKFFKVNDKFNESFLDVDISTDDWPFLYMPVRQYPITYVVVIILLSIISFFYINNIFYNIIII